MRHLTPVEIALFSGGDLGSWERWRVSRHIARCSQCRGDAAAQRDALTEFRDLADHSSELPNGLNWNRLAAEMTGNIRVGLAAGEAISQFDKPLHSKPRLAWKPALVAVGAVLIFAVAFWTSLPPQQAEHLLTSLQRIRTERIGTLVHSAVHPANTLGAPEDVVLEASSSSIQVRENGRALSLIPRSDGASVSVSMPGSAGVRFVDADTGQAMTNKVYYAEQ
jgi:hypothetical protein